MTSTEQTTITYRLADGTSLSDEYDGDIAAARSHVIDSLKSGFVVIVETDVYGSATETVIPAHAVSRVTI